MTSFALTASPTLNLDWVNVINNQVMTTSYKVSDAFGKLHKNVLQKIEKLDCSPEFLSANFSAHEEIIQAGAVQRASKYYEMTKDGFIFLVMGFTGKEAARIKENYITVFNQMAQLLQQQQNVYQPDILNMAERMTIPEMARVTQLDRMTITQFLAQNYQLKAQHSLTEDVMQTLQQFWLAVKIISGIVQVNHSSIENEIALNLKHLYRVASQLKHKLPPKQFMFKILRLSVNPLFIKIQTIHRSSIFHKPTKVWRFKKYQGPRGVTFL
ncbi:Rha family transcriptional regulator [Acinetobacter baumannii]|uniref:Rha family transcriptional regulator n=1 Tax=Acinetobacter baumannii TaxID=470 RepID=UPI00189B3B68|nr:Rha family transcriptional regulator [Acinetobacter baumannii]MBF6689275.1 Rha family transcriptional regulator [Acinetobacter baumannii]MBF6971098.1 Rha family transcriptional regulator [Acinetobacter baumannii]